VWVVTLNFASKGAIFFYELIKIARKGAKTQSLLKKVLAKFQKSFKGSLKSNANSPDSSGNPFSCFFSKKKIVTDSRK
jgi:hypothetical protein